MEQRWLSDKKPILAKSDLHTCEDGEWETIILRHSDLEQSDVDLITENFAYATYLDLSYNEKIATINFLLTPTTLYLKNCTSMRDITYRFPTCTLKNLDIAGSAIDIEEHFSKYKFPLLENLALSWQPNIKWHKLFGKLGALQRLTIETTSSHGGQVAGPKCSQHSCHELFKALGEHENIKAITFVGTPSEDDIAHLSKLTGRSLEFRIRNGAVNCLAKFWHLQNLHTIFLEHTNHIKDADLLKLITTCSNLSKITLDYCDAVTKDFVFQAAEFLKERDKNEPLKARLHLEIFSCAGITEDIQADPLYAKAESAMSLILFFKCKHPTTDYRNDLIIPYPPPNTQLSIYILFEIFKKLKPRSLSQRFAIVCEDFENAAIEEERHLKIIACRKAKIVNNYIYDAYQEITLENEDFFKTRLWTNATKMELSNRVLKFQNIFADFPKLKRLKLLNCAVSAEDMPRNKKFQNVTDLEICGEQTLRLWQALAVHLPNIATVNLAYATWEHELCTAMDVLPILIDSNMFDNVTSVTTVGIVLRDEDLTFLTHLANLKIFSVSRNSHITGKYFSELGSIEELQINDCENFQQYYLADILSYLDLKFLGVRDCPLALTSARHTNEMWLNCKMLSKLKMDWRNEHTIMAVQILNTLVDLEVRGCKAKFSETSARGLALAEAAADLIPLEQRFFRTLIERTGITKLTLEAELLSRNLRYLQLLQHLTHLSIIAIPLDIFPIAPNFYQAIARLTNLEYLYLAHFFYCYDGLMHIVGRCTRLQNVRLKDCVGFSDFVVYDLVEVVKRKRTKEQLPLSLYMHNSKDEAGDTCSEESSSGAGDKNQRFEDVAEYIKVVFVEEPKYEPSNSKPPFLDEVLCLE